MAIILLMPLLLSILAPQFAAWFVIPFVMLQSIFEEAFGFLYVHSFFMKILFGGETVGSLGQFWRELIVMLMIYLAVGAFLGWLYGKNEELKMRKRMKHI
ncbi:MAG: hypothetical protein A2849_00425 [Candidatus Taylorbacteria bacterium RIFCSPHIGHO2_01_FULL_51_15]|uniref:Uncharacterized protein n=1 Tax=Candidatus Taylorbacteria bacterium RIFCSPHIGHO2_01_FULL_51_15 TaxID=1802304 RepID=A0A1G2MDL2_9BACT|nr:MAG: hypothetical protein A2849_00425 [Candidatus Taylorbacteria bacterium RIFCSPHIGHO2_01_FULL_51_15]